MTNQLDLPLVLHLRSDYESIPDHQASHDLLVRDAGIRRRRVRNWREFSEALKEEIPALITIHYNELKNSHNQTPEKFINFVQGLVNYVGSNQSKTEHNIPIAIGINQRCNRHLVNRLQQVPGLVGVFLAVDDTDPADNAERTWAHREFLAGRTYWPDHIIDQLPAIKQKPKMIYFRSPNDDVTKYDPNVIAEYNKVLSVDVVTCDGWNELDRLLLDKPDQISINSNVFTNTDAATIKETIGMLQTRLKLAGLNIPIALVVENSTPKQVVMEAQKLGLQGLIPYHGDWDPADIMIALEALTNRKQHWPQHIIDQLPNIKEKPVHVYFRETRDEGTNVTPELVEHYNQYLPVRAIMCTSWPEFDQLIASTTPHQVVLHASRMSTQNATIPEMIAMIETKLKLYNLHDVPIAMIVDRDTPFKEVKSWKRLGVFGIVPFIDDKDTHAETIRGVEALTNRIPYWPRHIVDQLPTDQPQVSKNTPGTITLTVRQQEVMNLICRRGLSNKQIAKSLSLSESTVKIHVSAVMRAYGVRNRTQLALSASDNLKA